MNRFTVQVWNTPGEGWRMKVTPNDPKIGYNVVTYGPFETEEDAMCGLYPKPPEVKPAKKKVARRKK